MTCHILVVTIMTLMISSPTMCACCGDLDGCITGLAVCPCWLNFHDWHTTSSFQLSGLCPAASIPWLILIALSVLG